MRLEPIDGRSRDDRRAAVARERKARQTGKWDAWETLPVPPCFRPRSDGWSSKISRLHRNGLYVVLVRELASGVVHLAIRTPSSFEPPWRDLQRIKNELFGPDRFALQVCPSTERLIDEADMYHLWIMPAGFEPGFGLHDLDEVQS